MKRPIDVLRRLVDGAITWALYKHVLGKPGQTVERMTTPEEKELLRQLKAEDTTNDRWPSYDGLLDKDNEATQRRLRKEARDRLPKE